MEQALSSTDDAVYYLDMHGPSTLAVVNDYVRRSRALAARASIEADLPYGQAHSFQRFSVVWPQRRQDTRMAVVFFHGGWWKAGNKEDRLFLAENLLPEGIAFVSVGYPLAPEHSLATLAQCAEQAARRVGEHLHAALGRAVPIVLSGNSAGAHLAAHAAGALAGTASDAQRHDIVGLCVASGLYDLEPIRQSFPNEWLSLSESDVAALSPVHHLPAPSLPVMLAVGEREPPGFRAQQEHYLELLRQAGAKPQACVAPDHDHFTVIAEFGHVGQPLHDWLLACRNAPGARTPEAHH